MNRSGVRTRLLLSFLLVGITLFVFLQVADHRFITFDDREYVTENRMVRKGITSEGIRWAFTARHSSNWHPLTWISHMADVEWFGLSAGGHHLMNVVFHAANSVLVFLLLSMMTGDPWRSVFVAALFSVHPLHVESVAWVSERKDVLSTLFGLLAMLAYLRYVRRPGVFRYCAVVVLFALSLLSKPMLVTLPFLLFLLDGWPLGRIPGLISGVSGDESRLSRALVRLAAEKAPLFLLSAVSSVVTYWVQKGSGAVVSSKIFPFSVRLQNAVVSYGQYIGKTVWPFSLSVYYPHPGDSLAAWEVILSGCLLLGVSFLAIRNWRKRPYLAVGWLWFLGTLIPVIGLVQVGEQAIADRYTYLPVLGLFLMAAWGISEAMPDRRWKRKLLPAASILAVCVLAFAARKQVSYWRDTVTLFRHAREVAPNNWQAEENLALGMLEAGRNEEAIRHLQEVIRLRPDDTVPYNDFGVALTRMGNIEQAEEQFRKALLVDPENPVANYNLGHLLINRVELEQAMEHLRRALRIRSDFPEAHNHLGVVLDRMGRTEEALFHYREAVTGNPEDENAQYNLGLLLEKTGDLDGAVRSFRAAARLREADAIVRYSLGSALEKTGDLEGAEREHRESIRIAPAFAQAYNGLGMVLGRQGKTDEAILQFREAIRLKPDLARAHSNLCAALFRKGLLEEAISHCREALKINPGIASAHNNLGVVLEELGRTGEATAHYREALRIDPGYENARRNLNTAMERRKNRGNGNSRKSAEAADR